MLRTAAANLAATTRWEKSNGRTSCVLGPANTRGSQSDIAAALREDTGPSRVATASTRGLGAAATTTAHPSTTERRQTSENRLPAPAAARTLAEKTLARRRRARPRRRQRTCPPRHRNDPGREWCSTVATGAPNCHARRDVHNSTSNTARDHFPERLRSLARGRESPASRRTSSSAR